MSILNSKIVEVRFFQILSKIYKLLYWREAFVFVIIQVFMGISGLLNYLKNCLKERRVSDYRGKTAAVDTYAWLHKIIKGPSGRELILGGPNRYRYVNDCLKRIAKIQSHGVKVIMVFDGGPLPCKRGEEQNRRKHREELFTKGKEMLDKGDEAGFKKLVESIDISPDIAYRLIAELKKKGIQYIVAPYEADAQLAYLSRQGIADVIITEDSDLMAFGARRMLYKLDFGTMVGCELDLDEIPISRQANFAWFTHCMFLTTCILSGCDYLPQINGIGLRTAQKFIGRVTTFRGFIGELGSKNSDVPSNYQINFMKAFLTFRFQRVFCPRRRACVELNDMGNLSKSLNQLIQEEKSNKRWSQQVINLEVMEYVQINTIDFAFLGEKYSDQICCRIADADIHPVTLTQFDHNFAQGLSYVPVVPIRTNSILTNARNIPLKPGPKAKSSGQYNNQASIMNKFLNQGSKKFDPFAYEYKSLRNGEKVEVRVEDQKQLTVPQLKPIKGGLRFRQSEEDSDIEESPPASEIMSPSIQEISGDENSKQQILVCQLKTGTQPQPKRCKDELQNIAQKLFGQIFSQDYLKSPFSV